MNIPIYSNNLPFYEADERLTSFEANEANKANKEWAGRLGHKQWH